MGVLQVTMMVGCRGHLHPRLHGSNGPGKTVPGHWNDYCKTVVQWRAHRRALHDDSSGQLPLGHNRRRKPLMRAQDCAYKGNAGAGGTGRQHRGRNGGRGVDETSFASCTARTPLKSAGVWNPACCSFCRTCGARHSSSPADMSQSHILQGRNGCSRQPGGYWPRRRR